MQMLFKCVRYGVGDGDNGKTIGTYVVRETDKSIFIRPEVLEYREDPRMGREDLKLSKDKTGPNAWTFWPELQELTVYPNREGVPYLFTPAR